MPILEILVNREDSDLMDYYRKLENKETSDSGVDLISPEEIKVEPNSIETINFDIKCQMKDKSGNFIPYYLYPRSSISKTPLIMANSVGIIDSEYRGNIMAKVRNIPIKEKIVGNRDIFTIEKGTRLFQICSPDLSPLKVKCVDELSTTSRGSGGFGSTGLKY